MSAIASAMFAGKDESVVGKPDPLIVGEGPEFFYVE